MIFLMTTRSSNPIESLLKLPFGVFNEQFLRIRKMINNQSQNQNVVGYEG